MKIKSSGSFNRTKRFLKKMSDNELSRVEQQSFRSYANELMTALYHATPKDTGETANSWSYKVTFENRKVRLDIYNDNVNDGVCIAILLQYGHATNGGGYVAGVDYINPAVQPIFDQIEDKFWKEVVTIADKH